MMGGCHKEVVYDNMRNVVTKFIGKNEKELNDDLVKMSLYYGFRINVTNCFKSNEKGHSWGSVKVLRNQIFADNDERDYLKVLCDEVFGRANFVCGILWEKKYSPQNDAKWLSDSHDYILLYAKNKDIWSLNL